MTDLNSVNIIGRLTHDIGENDFAYTNGGIARMNFSIAVNRSVKRNEQWTDEVSYLDVTYWGKGAEAVKPYIGRGKQVAVSGFLKQERWEKDGQKHSKVSVVADSVQLLGGKNENSDGGNYQSNGGQSKQAFTPKPQTDQPASGEDFPEDIPF